MTIAVKVKLKGRDAARYLGQLPAPPGGSLSPPRELDSGAPVKKKRLVVIRRGKR